MPSSPDVRRNHRGHALEVVPTICSECGAAAEHVKGDAIYPHRPDLAHKDFYRCACGARVGCHPNTLEPLGAPASETTRRARSNAHAHFDALTRASDKRGNGKGDVRVRAYDWLARELGIDREQCHIGMMVSNTKASRTRKRTS